MCICCLYKWICLFTNIMRFKFYYLFIIIIIFYNLNFKHHLKTGKTRWRRAGGTCHQATHWSPPWALWSSCSWLRWELPWFCSGRTDWLTKVDEASFSTPSSVTHNFIIVYVCVTCMSAFVSVFRWVCVVAAMPLYVCVSVSVSLHACDSAVSPSCVA